MSKWKKAKERLLTCPKDYSCRELIEFLISIGYEKIETDGPAFIMYEHFQEQFILLPKEEYVSSYVLLTIVNLLKENGDL